MESSMAGSILEGKITTNTDQLFISVFKATVAKNSTKTAILYEDDNSGQRLITFRSMDEISDKIAKVLQRYCKSVERKDNIVAVSLKPTERLPMILLAIMKAGASYLPIDIEFTDDRVKYILKDAQPSLCIVEKTDNTSIYNNVITVTDEQIFLESEAEEGKMIINEDVSKIALILYTSGSTGTPKGVKLQYSALMNRLIWQWTELPFNQNEDSCIFKTALTFVDSVSEIWGPLLQGRTLIIIPRDVTKNPERFTALINKYKIQRLVLVPSLLKSLLMYLKIEEDKDSLKSLKLWVCSGEVLSVSLVQEFFHWFACKDKVIANFYGSTEIMGDVTFHLIRENDPYIIQNRIPIGKPVDNCTVYIVDQYVNLVPHGEIGELLIAGKNLADGYVHDNNSQKFISNPFSSKEEYSKAFRTGDYARIDNSVLYYEGRQDNQVKIRGHRVDLSEIEKAVLNLLFVQDAVVLSYNSNESEQVLLCFVVLKQKKLNLGIKTIKSLLSGSLLSYMIPQIIMIDTIPLLTNGKTDRQRLLEIYKMSESKSEKEQHEFDYHNVSAEDLMKAYVLFPTIASVIGLSNRSCININSNFYELGGNSLNTVYTVLKLREQGFHIGITDFITAKSIKDILLKMRKGNLTDDTEDTLDPQQNTLEILNDSHKQEVIEMITDSFFTKADLERWLLPAIKKEDYFDLMQELWNPLVEKEFSFILKSSSDNKILSVALNFDARDEPPIVIKSKLNIIFDFLEYLENPIRDTRLPKGKNKIFHTFMMATSNELTAADNVLLMRIMEQKCLEIAKKNNFSGIFTTNTSPLTQQLGTDVFSYEVLLDYQVNQYVTSDGSKPFAEAPDDQRAIVSWKKINYEQ